MDEDFRKAALDYHRLPRPGKLAIEPTKRMATQRDLALAYSPGVAAACLEIKADPHTVQIPVIMLTTTDDPREVRRCYDLGCSSYVTKPVAYERFVEAIRHLGLFLSIVEVPREDAKA